MEARWVVDTDSPEVTKHLQHALGIHPVLCSMLARRGIQTYDQAYRFFCPDLKDLHDPFLMKDMDRAVERVYRAISDGERILVYGDYDVDGTTSVALIYSFFRDLHDKIEYYVPDRYKEGYGLSTRGLDWGKERGCSLMICLDCGVKALDQVRYASGLGIDAIICDHHLPGPVLPEALALLDPKRPDCDYPYKELSGCGIGFKLIQAYAKRYNVPEERVHGQLDLVALAIAADIVPIDGENRVLAYHGLKVLNSAPRKGIAALMGKAGLSKEIGIAQIVFGLAPRINAAGRMVDAHNAVKLLISENVESAGLQSQILNRNNEERKTLDKKITAEALRKLQAREDNASLCTSVVYDPGWKKGVIGIVASRLIESYHRPTVVLTQSGDWLSGSARSVPGYDIYAAISECEDLLKTFGGHKYAAGLTMRPENLRRFQDRLEEVVSSSIPRELLVPRIDIAGELDFAQIDFRFFNTLKRFEPFGPNNMRPVFLTRTVRATEHSRLVGEDHIKAVFRDEDDQTLKGMGFRMGKRFELLRKQPVHICYTLDTNEWRGVKSLELYLRDFKTEIP